MAAAAAAVVNHRMKLCVRERLHRRHWETIFFFGGPKVDRSRGFSCIQGDYWFVRDFTAFRNRNDVRIYYIISSNRDTNRSCLIFSLCSTCTNITIIIIPIREHNILYTYLVELSVLWYTHILYSRVQIAFSADFSSYKTRASSVNYIILCIRLKYCCM